MRITKVYTRTGDGGQTRLVGGRQVGKDSLRVEAYGTVDELNAVIGLVRVFNQDGQADHPSVSRVEHETRWMQNKLFDIGGLLATAPDQVFPGMPHITDEDIVHLEQVMDRCQEDLEPLTEFILPGGGKVSGFLHQARTVCRRAERICVRLTKEESVDGAVIRFLNRLSDTLFVLARWVAKTQQEPEYLWERS